MCDTGDVKIGENQQQSGINVRFAVTLSPTVKTKKKTLVKIDKEASNDNCRNPVYNHWNTRNIPKDSCTNTERKRNPRIAVIIIESTDDSCGCLPLQRFSPKTSRMKIQIIKC